MPSCSLSQLTLVTSFVQYSCGKLHGCIVGVLSLCNTSVHRAQLFSVCIQLCHRLCWLLYILSKEWVAPPYQEVTFARVWAVLTPLTFMVFGIFVTLFVTSELMTYPLFWDTTQRRAVIPYRRFGTNYRPYLQASRSLVTIKDGTDKLPRNVGTELQL